MTYTLRDRVIESLCTIIDPETLQDVWHMKLVRDLHVTEEGDVSLTFRPSSVRCPLGFPLGIQIKKTLTALEGVRRVSIKVEGFFGAQELERLLKEMDR